MSPRYDLIVIGGNAGGLSAAMVGRQSGMERVRILESDATVAFPDVLGEHGLDVGYGEKVVAVDVGEDGHLVITSDRQSYGARACLVGRAYLYGLMAGGERGVQRAVDILSREITRTLQLLGVATVAELTADRVRLRP